MTHLKLLVVEDEKSLQDIYRSLLEGDSRLCDKFDLTLCTSAEAAIKALRQMTPDLVILDWVLPGKDGMIVLDAIRSDPKARYAVVFVVTSHNDKDREVEALEAGADDFLVKPFDREVLVARLLNLSKRVKLPPESLESIQLKDLRLEMPRGRLWIRTKPVELHHKEAELLRVFLKRPDMVHSSEFLWDTVWGYASEEYKNTLQVTLSNLRKKLGPRWGKQLDNIQGQGYVLNTA